MAEVPTWIGISLADRYEIQRLLGSGGMSAVYQAYDNRLKRQVAVKLIHTHLASEQSFRDRFEAEAAAIASLNHPHIVGVYDFDNHGDSCYIVMEYLEGQTLSDLIESYQDDGKNMSLGQVVEMMAYLCEIVHYAHVKGVIHRDLKPGNVMILPDGTPELMDFGIAKLASSDTKTATGVVVGTVAYIAPEQILGRGVDHRVDIYALGVMLYELLSGRRPFDGETTLSVMRQHLDEFPPALESLVPNIPIALDEVVQTALAKNKDDRFENAAEMAAALRSVPLSHEEKEAERKFDQTAIMFDPVEYEFDEDTTRRHRVSDSSITTSKNRRSPNTIKHTQPQRSGSNWVVWSGVALVVALLLGGFGFFFLLEDPNSDADQDGLTLREENELGTDPESKDTDGDDFIDSAERGVQCLDPLNPDTDGDGLLDGRDEDPCTPAPPELSVEITGISIVGAEMLMPTAPVEGGDMYGSYGDGSAASSETLSEIDGSEDRLLEVEFQTFGFEPTFSDFHLHFYYDTIPVTEAGQPGNGPWVLHQNSQTVRQFELSSTPAEATQICAIVSNADHMVDARTATCIPIPER